MKKIVFLHTDFRIYWPARINKLFSYLSVLGFEFSVIEISGSGENYNFAINSKQADYWECLFPDKGISEIDPKLIRTKTLDRLNQLKPDILITGALAFPSGATGAFYANEKHIPLIVFDDAKLEDVQRDFFTNFVKKQLYSGVDAIFCPAPGWESTFRFFGFDPHRLFYGVDVIDNDFFMKAEISEDLVHSLPESYFLNVGRQVEKKNLLMLLKSYHQLIQKKGNVPDLVLVGEGQKRKELEDYIVEHHLNKVHLLPFLPQQSVREIYRCATAFILPSTFGETWGLVINEAMASGLPVIVSNRVGCVGTLVKEGVNGFIFDANSIESMTGALIKFADLSAEEKKAMSHSSLEIIQDWGLDKFNEGMINAITFVSQNPKRKISFVGKVISKFWLGRYNSL
jgi:glycosyltransferase involved in cell wall biosynthesis